MNLFLRAPITFFSIFFMFNMSLYGEAHKGHWYHHVQETIVDFLGGESLAANDVSLETEQLVRQIQQELGMQNWHIRIKQMNPSAIEKFGYKNAFAFPFGNFIALNEEWLKTLTPDEQRALIGHELIHLKKYHVFKQIGLVTSVALLIDYCSQKNMSKKIINALPEKLKDFLYDIRDSWHKIQAESRVLKKIDPRMLMIAAIACKYSRGCEKEADLLAASQLKCAAGGANLFRKFKENSEDPESRFRIKRFYKRLLKRWQPIEKIQHFFYGRHPKLEERITYLSELAQQQNDPKTPDNSTQIQQQSNSQSHLPTQNC